MTHTVLITGVRAKTGAPLADLLASRGDVDVRGGTSAPAATAASDRLRPVAFSWDDRLTWREASDGADAVFLVRPDRPDAPELMSAFVEQIPPDSRVVLLSELDRGFFAADDWAMRAERAVRAAGRPWTILRPNWFMQVFSDPRFFRPDILDRGVLRFPSAGRPVAWIDARDIAAVAERALLETGHAGQVYDLTGPTAVPLSRVAELLSESLERPVRHEDISLEAALGDSHGFQRENDLGAYDRIRNGWAAHVTDTVELVTGRAARTFEQFVREEPSLRPG